MTPFVIPFDASRLDLRRTLDCGQVFRFKVNGSGDWEGYDGSDGLVIRQVGDELAGRADGGEEAVRRLLDLDFDEGLLMDEVRIAAPELTVVNRGVRLVQLQDSVEVVFSFLCTPNNNLHRIVPMVRHLAPLGKPFPSLESLASLDPAQLRAHGFGYRAEWIPRAARAILARGGTDWLAHLRTVPYAEAFAALLSLPGFGPKLADCALLYGFGHTEAFPVDTHVWKVVGPAVFPEWADKSLTLNRYRQIGDWMRERFGRDAGRVQQLVFVDRLETHGSRRVVKGRGEKISPEEGNAPFEPEIPC